LTIIILAVLAAAPAVLSTQTASADNTTTETVGSLPWKLTAVGEKNSTNEECSLGNLVADAARYYLETDVAIICGGDLAGNLSPGELTKDELIGVFAEDRVLATTSVTVKSLREILETGVSHITLDESEKVDGILSSYDGFPQISGFVFYYDVSSPAGERVYDIKIDGESVDLSDDRRYLTLSAPGYMLEGGYGFPAFDNTALSGVTLSEVTAWYISNGMPGYSRTENRTHIRGAYDGGLAAYVPYQILPFAVILFFIAYTSRSKRGEKTKTRENTPWY